MIDESEIGRPLAENIQPNGNIDSDPIALIQQAIREKDDQPPKVGWFVCKKEIKDVND